MRKSLAILLSLKIVLTVLAAVENEPLQPVADPRPVLADLQRKMSSLQSVALDFTQERHLKLFTEPLKSHAGIKDEIAFVGLGHKFQIWESERFRAELAEATEKVRAWKKRLGSRVAAEGPHGARE